MKSKHYLLLIYLILLILTAANELFAKPCSKYGKDTPKSLKTILESGSMIEKKLLTQPWVQCHYRGYSVSCQEYERLINKETYNGSDPNLGQRLP